MPDAAVALQDVDTVRIGGNEAKAAKKTHGGCVGVGVGGREAPDHGTAIRESPFRSKGEIARQKAHALGEEGTQENLAEAYGLVYVTEVDLADFTLVYGMDAIQGGPSTKKPRH